jgi:hypothetical protein
MLPTCLHRFQHLRVALSRQHGEAPYKPALLLAVLELSTKKEPRPTGRGSFVFIGPESYSFTKRWCEVPVPSVTFSR